MRSALAAALAMLALAALPAAAATPDRVAIPAGTTAKPLTLAGLLYLPAGQGPFPAVVALHGCGGLWSTGNPARPTSRSEDWAARLTGAGFVVLFPDSFGSRGLGSQCTVAQRTVRPTRERKADADAARIYLQAQPFVRPGAVALLGWSNGSSTVLAAVDEKAAPKGGPDFRGAVALYPGCRAAAESGSWAARMPLLILIGEADNWTPAAPCKALAAREQKVTLKTYPGAYHDFDDASQKLRQRSGLAFTADGSGKAMTGYDPAAYADAVVAVPAFLKSLLGP